MRSESEALSYWPVTIVPKSKLLHMATAHHGFVPKLSPHGGKTPRFALKNLFWLASGYGFYCFASDDVFSCETTSDEGMDCAGACSLAKSHDISTEAHSAKTSEEGF